jgi:pSer/pThr/pTyr-binding forkhead associated (FHA) protein
MKLNLIVNDGAHKGKAIPITKKEFVIGRDPKCHLRPSSGAVSKKHCTLIFRDGKLFVRDLNSTNGTFINDKQIKGEHPLSNEDKLSIGPLSFLVRMEGLPAAVEQPKPAAPVGARTTKGMDDEAVADMLLLLDEQEEAGTLDMLDDNIPSGSTLMEMLPSVSEELDKQEQERRKAASDGSKYDQLKQAQADTSSAAKDILKQYSRRRP